MDFSFVFKTKNVSLTEIYLILIKLLIDYFSELEEESVKDNFVVIYELLDEIIDFGFPQITESKILHEFVLYKTNVIKIRYITQQSYKLKVARPPMAVTNAVSWRSDGIKYRKNQIFVDIMEHINCLVKI